MLNNAIPRALKNNRMVHSPHYATILKEYNTRLERGDKISNRQFYFEVVSGLIPNYSIVSWYAFLKKFNTSSGLMAANTMALQTTGEENLGKEAATFSRNMMTNAEATQKLIAGSLNISAEAVKKLLENPELLTAKERIEIGLKAMKAQDSRIHAVGKIREDNREQEKFERAFDDSAYNE